MVPLAENRHRAPRCLAKPSGEAPGGARLHSEYLELSPRIICTPPGQGYMDAPRRRVKVPGYAASGKPIPGAGIKFETCAAQRSSAAFFSAAYP